MAIKSESFSLLKSLDICSVSVEVNGKPQMMDINRFLNVMRSLDKAEMLKVDNSTEYKNIYFEKTARFEYIVSTF